MEGEGRLTNQRTKDERRDQVRTLIAPSRTKIPNGQIGDFLRRILAPPPLPWQTGIRAENSRKVIFSPNSWDPALSSMTGLGGPFIGMTSPAFLKDTTTTSRLTFSCVMPAT